MNVSIFSTKGYENKSNWTLSQNKPNQSQFKPIKANFKKMNVNFCATRYYESKPRIVYNVVVPVSAKRLSINWAKENPPSNSTG